MEAKSSIHSNAREYVQRLVDTRNNPGYTTVCKIQWWISRDYIKSNGAKKLINNGTMKNAIIKSHLLSDIADSEIFKLEWTLCHMLHVTVSC